MNKKDLDSMGGVIVRISQDTDGRVWVKDVTVEQPKEEKMKYKVGDKVRIKSWKEMEKEYGVDSHGDIKSGVPFLTSMRKYCGKIMTIQQVGWSWYYMEESGNWCLTDEMIKGLATKRTVIEYKELKDERIEIVGWKNVLKRDELPEEYFKGLNYYLTTEGKIRLNAAKYTTYLGINDYWFSKSEFEQIIKDMKRAGNRLGKILHKSKIKKVII